MKNRKGFTLLEMVVVIAIIVFISGVAMTGISQYTKRARDLSVKTNAHSAAIASEEAIVDQYLTTTRAATASETTNTSLQAVSPTVTEATTTKQEETTKKPTETTKKPTEATPQEPNLGDQNGNVVTTNTGFSHVKQLSAPAGVKVNGFNDQGHGGDVTIKNTVDMRQYTGYTVTITLVGDGKFRDCWGGDNQSKVSADGKTLTYTFKNDSNPGWTEPAFQQNGTYTMNWNYVDHNTHGSVNVTVVGIK